MRRAVREDEWAGARAHRRHPGQARGHPRVPRRAHDRRVRRAGARRRARDHRSDTRPRPGGQAALCPARRDRDRGQHPADRGQHHVQEDRRRGRGDRARRQGRRRGLHEVARRRTEAGRGDDRARPGRGTRGRVPADGHGPAARVGDRELRRDRGGARAARGRGVTARPVLARRSGRRTTRLALRPGHRRRRGDAPGGARDRRRQRPGGVGPLDRSPGRRPFSGGPPACTRAQGADRRPRGSRRPRVRARARPRRARPRRGPPHEGGLDRPRGRPALLRQAGRARRGGPDPRRGLRARRCERRAGGRGAQAADRANRGGAARPADRARDADVARKPAVTLQPCPSCQRSRRSGPASSRT